MSRYEVVFSPEARNALRRITRYIAGDSGRDRATQWLARITDATLALEAYPHGFPIVGGMERENIRARFVMRHVLYYFVDESARVVTVLDVVHSARHSERKRYEEG